MDFWFPGGKVGFERFRVMLLPQFLFAEAGWPTLSLLEGRGVDLSLRLQFSVWGQRGSALA